MTNRLQPMTPTVASPIGGAIPVSHRQRRGQLSLCDLPTEIRLEIFNHLLDVSNIPRSYGYTSPPARPTNPKPLRRHGVLLVSKQLSAEYRQAFYERTNFFLRVNGSNAFHGMPELQSNHTLSGSKPDAFLLNFWGAPDALLTNLRHCTLFIEVGDIAASPGSVHSVSRIVRANSDFGFALEVRREMQAYSSLEEFKAQDALFDSTLRMAFTVLLDHMQQLRSVQLVWDTSVETTRYQRFSRKASTNWSWNALGKPMVECLKNKWNLMSFQVKVGDKFGDEVCEGSRGEAGRWIIEKREV